MYSVWLGPVWAGDKPATLAGSCTILGAGALPIALCGTACWVVPDEGFWIDGRVGVTEVSDGTILGVAVAPVPKAALSIIAGGSAIRFRFWFPWSVENVGRL